MLICIAWEDHKEARTELIHLLLYTHVLRQLLELCESYSSVKQTLEGLLLLHVDIAQKLDFKAIAR